MANQTNEETCIQCQECCKWITFTVDQATAFTLEKFYLDRGCQLVPVPNDQVAIMVPSKCPKLSPFGCRIYDERSHSCRSYDGRIDILMRDKCMLPKTEGG